MADELEVRVTVTRKQSSDNGGADEQIATVASTMSSADRLRFLAFLFATHGLDAEGEQRTQQEIVEAFWAGIAAGTVANIERHEREAAAQTARDGVTPITVTQGT